MKWFLRNIAYSLAWLAIFAGGFVCEFTNNKLAGLGVIAVGFGSIPSIAIALGRFPRYGKPNRTELAREDLPLLFWLVVAIFSAFSAGFFIALLRAIAT
jgi:hypothetical protein